MSLKEYQRKRKFHQTPEPRGAQAKKTKRGQLRFVVQKHDASRTHYDFRLEMDGTLKSWAVPKGPSMTSQDPRLAVKVEDHPMEYGSFEGVIPPGNYGAGTVMVWDEGTYVERTSEGRKDSEERLKAGLAKGHLTFLLSGKKLRGEFALVKLNKKGAPDNGWLLIKKHDKEATRKDVLLQDRSAKSGRTLEKIATESEAKGDVWLPRKGKVNAAPLSKAKPREKTKPCEPVFGAKIPEGKNWVYEPFGQGTRLLAELGQGKVNLYSRSLLPLDKKFPEVITQLKKMGGRAVLDGEVIRKSGETVFLLCDLLEYEGRDLRAKPLKERRKLLEKLKLVKNVELMPQSNRAAEVKAATLVAKNTDSPYQSGLSRDWVRVRQNLATVSDQQTPPLTHLTKVFFPDEGYTKGDLIAYYDKIAPTILPHLVDRPQSLHRHPNGIRAAGFFHKDMSSFLPRRIQTLRVVSGSSDRTINYALCQDKWSLLFLINMGCIELNPWLSRRQNLEHPDYLVIDLDPENNSFEEVIEVAQTVHRILKQLNCVSFCKTSGSRGLHICVPTGGKYDYDLCREFAEAVCQAVHQKHPKNTSLERNPNRRRGKIYLDFMQNRRSQTLAAVYCVRPRPGATVSAPLKWAEVKKGLSPSQFTIKTMPQRVQKLGDLWRPMLTKKSNIEKALKELRKKFHILPAQK